MRLAIVLTGALAGVVAGPGLSPARAHAEDVALVSATASSETGEAHAVSRLFDLDEATTWCAREKARVSVTMQLERAAELGALHLALGDFSDWRGGPRVKQVYATVFMGDAMVKKIRHKWPDADEPRDGRVELRAPGDRVLVELDLVYAGQGTGGLCLSGMRLDGVDTAALAAQAWGARNVEQRLAGTYTVDGATLELKKRGKLSWKGGDLRVEGKWRVDGGALRLEVTRARLGKGKLDDVTLTGALRFGPRAEGDAPTFTPWFAFTAEGGTLGVKPPEAVTTP